MDPSTRKAAEWEALVDWEKWEEEGGHWGRKAKWSERDGEWNFLLSVLPSESVPISSRERDFYGYLRFLQTSLYPEAVEKGTGVVIGAMEGDTVKSLRTRLKAVADKYEERLEQDLLCPVPRRYPAPLSFANHSRKRVHAEDPLTYVKGFLDGSRDNPQADKTHTYQTGWLHGRDYSIGSCPIPQWLTDNTQEASNG